MSKQHNVGSVLVNGPNDPPVIKRDIVVQKVVEVAMLTATTMYNYSTIYANLDLSISPFFSDMRVSKVSVFGLPSATGSTVVSATVISDGAQYLDRGVGTARLPCLHIRLPEITRITWVSTGSTTNVVNVSGGIGVIVQFTIEVRADASGDN